MIDIFKIQLPIVSSEMEPQAFIYNKDKRIMLELPVSQVLSHFKGDELKVYVLAEPTINGLEIIKRVQYQDW